MIIRPTNHRKKINSRLTSLFRNFILSPWTTGLSIPSFIFIRFVSFLIFCDIPLSLHSFLSIKGITVLCQANLRSIRKFTPHVRSQRIIFFYMTKDTLQINCRAVTN